MRANRLAIGVVAGSLLPSIGAVQSGSLHFNCGLGSLIRQVEVRSDDPDRGVPCEVLYRKESERPGFEEVLWSAQMDPQFCSDKALDFVEHLESYGWACEPAEPSSTPEAVEARVPPALEPEPTPTLPAAAPPDLAPDPVLEAAIAQDLDQLKGSAETAVEADIGAIGDLNDDGLDDAAVVITFDADGADHAQYLVAYVTDGTTFRPAASKFLGGRYREVYGGDVQEIQDGQILVNLHVLKADDPYCCPSGEQSASYALEGEELLRRE